MVKREIKKNITKKKKTKKKTTKKKIYRRKLSTKISKKRLTGGSTETEEKISITKFALFLYCYNRLYKLVFKGKSEKIPKILSENMEYVRNYFNDLDFEEEEIIINYTSSTNISVGSYHYLLENGSCILLLFSNGSPFIEFEFDNDLLLRIEEKQKIFLCGHSMGAGFAYLLAVQLLNRGIVDPSYLFVFITGLGRIPNTLSKKFKILHDKYNFNVIDIISLEYIPNNIDLSGHRKNSQSYYTDSWLDRITVFTNDCNPTNPKSPFYCRNEGGKIPENFNLPVQQLQMRIDNLLFKPGGGYNFNKSWKKNLKNLVQKGLLSDKQRKYYESYYCWESDWGELYSDRWNKCQELFDKVYNHNSVETYSVDSNGVILSVNKNNLLRKLNVQMTGVQRQIFKGIWECNNHRAGTYYFYLNKMNKFPEKLVSI